MTDVFSLNLHWQWFSVRALCWFRCNFWFLDKCCVGWKKKKNLHLHYSILTCSLISAQGHQYFWHFSGWNKYRMNVPLLCLGSCTSPSINKQSICQLVQSDDERDAGPTGVCRLSIPCIINNIQFGLLNYENTLHVHVREIKKSTSCMSNE